MLSCNSRIERILLLEVKAQNRYEWCKQDQDRSNKKSREVFLFQADSKLWELCAVWEE